MSFWDLEDKNEKIDESGSFETGGGDMEPIPAKTQVKAAIDEAKWDEYEGERYINLRWTVLGPDEYKNRKVFQKVKVYGDKADKAKKMLAAIAANCGGGLRKVKGEPTNMDLQKYLIGKPMALLLQVWEIETEQGETKKGNWVSAVSPLKSKQKAPEPEKKEEPADDFDDDIPF